MINKFNSFHNPDSSILHRDISSRLHPGPLADLRKSGLDDETILESCIYSCPPKDINKKIGFPDPKIESLLCFPYRGCDGFERFKPFPLQNGKPKYLQKKGTGNNLYIPKKAQAILSDGSIPIYITEGEKKALKGCQEGLYCIAIGGLWNWSDGSEEKRLISDFGLIAWQERTVFLVPDSDWLNPDRHGERKNLRQAVYELAYRLIDRGAKVLVIELPLGPEKIGLDDYLCQHSVDVFRTLPKHPIRKQTIEEMIQGVTLNTLPEVMKRLANLKETEKAVHIGALSKKMDIPKRAIQKDLKKDETKRADATEILTTAYFPELVDLCIDKDGSVAFLINKNEILEVSPIYEIDGSLYKPPDKGKIPFLLPRAERVCSWANKDTGEILFNDLFNQLKRFSFIPDHQFVIATCFVFLTYLQDHPEIQYFPMLLFWSSPERGKSRTGKAVAYCSFRGLHIVDMREANLFRYSQNLHSTLFIDMMDLWKKAERNQSEDILLLRFEKGAKVARVLYPEKGAFKDMVYFDVYGPTVMATNEPVHHILDTRCLPISMPNKPENYENPTPPMLLEIRERLTAWHFKVMGKPLPMVEPISGINGRLWDISKPLFQVCQMVSPAHLDTLKGAILEIAGQRREEKQETIEGQIISIIDNLSTKELPEWTVPVEKILDRVNDKRAEGHKVTSQYLGKKLKAIGFNTRKVHGYAEVKLTKGDFDIFLNQFGLAAKNTDGEYVKETLPNSTIEKNALNSIDYSGRELVESGRECQETLPITLPEKSEANQEVISLVESGRVSTHTGHRKNSNKGKGETIDLTGVEVEIQP